MHGRWLLTWHEDKEITPGVPDLSYVMLGPGHETGWVELKAEPPGKSAKFKIESSQHQWMTPHVHRIPIHFLLAVGDEWFFVCACHHVRLTERITVEELTNIAVAKFPGDRVAENSFLFSNATKRITDGLQGIQRHQACHIDQGVP